MKYLYYIFVRIFGPSRERPMWELHTELKVWSDPKGEFPIETRYVLRDRKTGDMKVIKL